MKLIAWSHLHLLRRRLLQRVREQQELLADINATVYPEQLSIQDGRPKSVLILTPHADDESIGMGGTIRQHAANGDQIHVIVVSDNTASIVGDMASEEIILVREAEMQAAMAVLGVGGVEFLRIPQDRLRKGTPPEAFRETIDRRIVEIQANVLYLPFWSDNHHDHRILNLWTARTLHSISTPPPLIRMFEVWSPLPATAIVDISMDMETKLEAISCFESQTRVVDYAHHIRGLNAYRAMTVGDRKVTHCEAFCQMPLPAYFSILNRIS